MNLLVISNIVLVIGALTGMYCIAHHQKKGFIIFLGVEASMAYIGYSTKNYGLIVAAVLYLIMNVYSYTKWTQAENARRATAGRVKKVDERIKKVNEAIADGRLKINKRYGRVI